LADFFRVFAQPTVDTATAVATIAMTSNVTSRVNVVLNDFCRSVVVKLDLLRSSVAMGYSFY
jgi:hypothetical protein